MDKGEAVALSLAAAFQVSAGAEYIKQDRQHTAKNNTKENYSCIVLSAGTAELLEDLIEIASRLSQ